MLSAYVLREDDTHGGRVPSKYRRQNNRHVDCGPLNERRSNGKWALRSCTECGILLGANEGLLKAVWMTTLRFLNLFLILKPRGFVLDLLYARESSIAAVQSWRDHGRNNFTVELLDRNGRIEAILLSAGNVVRQRLLMCCFTDSVWSRCAPRYLTELWKGMLHFHQCLQIHSRQEAGEEYPLHVTGWWRDNVTQWWRVSPTCNRLVKG